MEKYNQDAYRHLAFSERLETPIGSTEGLGSCEILQHPPVASTIAEEAARHEVPESDTEPEEKYVDRAINTALTYQTGDRRTVLDEAEEATVSSARKSELKCFEDMINSRSRRPVGTAG